MAKKSVSAKKTAGKASYAWAALRIAIGFIFLWAFADKMVGLGFSTCRTTDPKTKVETVQVMCKKSVAKGSSPTVGFLKNGAKGPFKDTYNKMAGNKVVDVLFMSGLLLIGLALMSGAGVKIAVFTGSLLLLLMYTVALPVATNPILDDHIIYILALIGIYLANDDQKWGIGGWWKSQDIVKKYPVLE